MGLIQELADLVSKINFVTIVHEYEQGLYFRKGMVVEKPLRKIRAEDLAEIKQAEKALRRNLGLRGRLGLGAAKLPPECRRTWYGGIRHQRRYGKVLRAGLYFHLPLVEDIVKDYKQEKVLDLGYISVLTKDPGSESKAVIISCNLRYEMMDFYRAYTAVYDYEISLRFHTMSILAQKSLGKMYDDWKEPQTIINLEKRVVEELRKVVTEKWGLKIHQLYITDVTGARIFKFVGDGHALWPNMAVMSKPGP